MPVRSLPFETNLAHGACGVQIESFNNLSWDALNFSNVRNLRIFWKRHHRRLMAYDGCDAISRAR